MHWLLSHCLNLNPHSHYTHYHHHHCTRAHSPLFFIFPGCSAVIGKQHTQNRALLNRRPRACTVTGSGWHSLCCSTSVGTSYMEAVSQIAWYTAILKAAHDVSMNWEGFSEHSVRLGGIFHGVFVLWSLTRLELSLLFVSICVSLPVSFQISPKTQYQVWKGRCLENNHQNYTIYQSPKKKNNVKSQIFNFLTVLKLVCDTSFCWKK